MCNNIMQVSAYWMFSAFSSSCLCILLPQPVAGTELGVEVTSGRSTLSLMNCISAAGSVCGSRARRSRPTFLSPCAVDIQPTKYDCAYILLVRF